MRLRRRNARIGVDTSDGYIPYTGTRPEPVTTAQTIDADGVTSAIDIEDKFLLKTCFHLKSNDLQIQPFLTEVHFELPVYQLDKKIPLANDVDFNQTASIIEG